MDPALAVAAVLRAAPPLRGRGSIALRWHKRHVASTDVWDFAMRDGYRLRGAKASSQSWTAAFLGTYGEDAVDALAPYVEPDSVILDIGASMGFFTIPAARLARSVGAAVVSYEPVPANADLLRSNVELNGFQDLVTVRPVGLGPAADELAMVVEGAGAGNASITAGVGSQQLAGHVADGALNNTIRVPIETLDAQNLVNCTALKIDVEGFELDVLAGGVDLVRRSRPAIYAEFSPAWLTSRGYGPDAPAVWARTNEYVAYGYPTRRLHRWTEQGPGPAVRMDGEWLSGDVLLVPREKHQPV
jgi:FkbM family methyltransferase